MPDFSPGALDSFCARVLDPALGVEFAQRAGMAPELAGVYLRSICNEAHTGLRLLAWAGLGPALAPTQRVLEIGAGGGLLTAFLQSNGVNIVGIEPTGEGFEATPILMRLIAENVGIDPNVLPLAARDLNAETQGSFDLIFSVNVIEHFQPLAPNLDGIARVMAPGSVAVHTCPNYRVPYEPHYGIPLVPFMPHLTPKLMRRDVRSDSLWQSFNFITAADLRASARRHGLELAFKPAVIADTFQRVLNEPDFATRHPPVLTAFARLLRKTGMLHLLAKLPPAWATPMTVRFSRPFTPQAV